MKILHISMECYPAAKAGGMGDVVGALPIYLNKAGEEAAVIIPKHRTKWLEAQSYETIIQGDLRLHHGSVHYAIQKVKNDTLGFDLYVADIPGKFDRPGVYTDEHGRGYGDEIERHVCFQQAVLQWVMVMKERPDVLHCHDHHTGLIPFMINYCPEYKSLSNVPTVFTIHNGAYHGIFPKDRIHLLPYFEAGGMNILEWDNLINPLATAIKCCWRFTTVSNAYLEELKGNSNGLENLINSEIRKAHGILNGIDNATWDPKTDTYISSPLKKSIKTFKEKNKKNILERFNISPDIPIITFIGRLVKEKGADIIPSLVRRMLGEGKQVGFVVLGTGMKELHHTFAQLAHEYPTRFDVSLEYNEQLAHQLYAGSDFLLMPSRIEPCGLNQMYACRYGTIPMVRSVGGLRDSIPDMGEPDGSGLGIRFDQFNLEDAAYATWRAIELYNNTSTFNELREKIMKIDFSWEKSAKDYVEIYKELN